VSPLSRAVFSKWQSLRKNGKVRLATGPINQVAIPAPPYLRLVAPRAPPLGAALFRKQALAEVGGFPEALSFADPSLARKWYLRAQELGEAESGAALLRLGVAD